MNKKSGLFFLSLSLLASCADAKLPDNDKYKVDFPEGVSEDLLDHMVVHASEGRLIKVDGEYFFVDQQERFHVSIVDETDIFQGDVDQKVDQSILQDGEECIVVMANGGYIGHITLNIEEPTKYDPDNIFDDVASSLYLDVEKESVMQYYSPDTRVVWH